MELSVAVNDINVTRMQKSSWFFQMLDDWFEFQADFLTKYGWRVLGGLILSVMLWNWLQPRIQAWLRAREDAAYHKDPDRVLAREEALTRARAEQALRLRLESERKAELEKERQEQKRREAAELLEKYGYVPGGGRRLGSVDDNYLPLSGGGGSGSSYRAPKRSACSGGGCGR